MSCLRITHFEFDPQRERERGGGQAGRQTDRVTDRQAERQPYRQIRDSDNI